MLSNVPISIGRLLKRARSPANSNLALRCVEQPHGGLTTLGLRFDEGEHSAVYAVDFNHINDEMAALYEGVDVWIADCLTRTPHPTHAHLDMVLNWAREL